jgi:hypothetical protein
MRGNIVQGKISLISGQLPDTAGNLWITDASVSGQVPTIAPAETVKVTTTIQLPAPPPVIVTHDSLVYVPGPVVTKTDTLPRVCPPSTADTAMQWLKKAVGQITQ